VHVLDLGPTPSPSLVRGEAWKSPPLHCALHNAGLYQNAVRVAGSCQSAGFSQQTPHGTLHSLSKGTRPKGTPKPTCSGTDETADLEGTRPKGTPKPTCSGTDETADLEGTRPKGTPKPTCSGTDETADLEGTRPKGTPKPTCSGTDETADLEGNRLKATAVTVVRARGFRVQRSTNARWPR
jgi:hypothetical protein